MRLRLLLFVLVLMLPLLAHGEGDCFFGELKKSMEKVTQDLEQFGKTKQTQKDDITPKETTSQTATPKPAAPAIAPPTQTKTAPAATKAATQPTPAKAATKPAAAIKTKPFTEQSFYKALVKFDLADDQFTEKYKEWSAAIDQLRGGNFKGERAAMDRMLWAERNTDKIFKPNNFSPTELKDLSGHALAAIEMMQAIEEAQKQGLAKPSWDLQNKIKAFRRNLKWKRSYYEEQLNKYVKAFQEAGDSYDPASVREDNLKKMGDIANGFKSIALYADTSEVATRLATDIAQYEKEATEKNAAEAARKKEAAIEKERQERMLAEQDRQARIAERKQETETFNFSNGSAQAIAGFEVFLIGNKPTGSIGRIMLNEDGSFTLVSELPDFGFKKRTSLSDDDGQDIADALNKGLEWAKKAREHGVDVEKEIATIAGMKIRFFASKNGTEARVVFTWTILGKPFAMRFEANCPKCDVNQTLEYAAYRMSKAPLVAKDKKKEDKKMDEIFN